MPLTELISRPGKKAVCQICHEEIINGRETLKDGVVHCRSCAGETYYVSQASSLVPELHSG
jgi:formylmethanofuran dehydrogenase subunit E